MFETLSQRLSQSFDRLRGRGVLSEKDVDTAMRDIRMALLEADVGLPVVRDFIAQIREKAVGEETIRSIAPGQHVIKLVHDGIVELLGGRDPKPLHWPSTPPGVIMMVGLQGSGKTTSTGKLALYLKKHSEKKILLASLDTRRPAAMEQLALLAERAGVESLPIVVGQTPPEIARRALKAAELGGYDAVILDTAGRTSIDEDLMQEVQTLADLVKPSETLLVADSLTGQDAVETARRFHERLPLTGLILTRLDGDGRGGAALSMKAVTGLSIKFTGLGEKLEDFEVFDAQRLAGRLLDQGDVVALVEKATEQVDQDKAKKLARKLKKGSFDLEDLSDQLGQLQKMGGLSSLLGFLPGIGKAKKQLDQMGGADDSMIKRQRAIIFSMTPQERAQPKLLNASRKKRIARGSGVQVSDVNRLLKMHRQMADMMKKMGKGGTMTGPGMMGGLPPHMGGRSGLPGPGAMPSSGLMENTTPDKLKDLLGKLPSGKKG